MKLDPLTVKVKAADPAVLLVGERLVIAGTGLAVTTRLIALEMPPPGAGLKTVMGNEPALTTSVAVIWAVSWLPLTKEVVRSLPLNLMTEPLMKPEPLTVRVNATSPAVFVVGIMLLSTGCGLMTVRLTELYVPPPGPGLNTVIG